ncbi:MAG: BtaA family protein [Saprospiraceae bacterium]|nr:BtaA family protein [Saprospiraceae bacterium]
MGLARSVSEQVFRQIHGKNLVYNCCWEDPRCDREMMGIDENSRIAMLTSAGCNALDYLLDNPARIDCVDLNPRQNALLQFKVALFEGADHPNLFQFFGHGVHNQAREVYHDLVENRLPEEYSRRYWQRNLNYFNGKGLRRSFFWHGTSGTIAWFIRKWFNSQPGAVRQLHQLFQSASLDEQRERYKRLEPVIVNRFVRWLVRQHVVQSMIGVPKSQQHLAAKYFPDGLVGYLRHCLRHVFLSIPVQDNYFWKLYFYGHYETDCCPNYLMAENFNTYKSRVNRIRTHTDSLSGFLQANPGKYTHFVLLDHQDWLASHMRHALDEEWQLIFDNAAPGAKVLLRSAAFDIDFIPEFARERIRFDRDAALRSEQADRVGTYASTWFGTILT